jgi:hypothetical protein
MNTSECFRALRRANPRSRVDFAESVDAVRARIVEFPLQVARPGRRRGVLRLSAAGVALAAAAAVVVALTVASPGGGPRVENAAAAIRKAATLTAASAERSGTAVVRMTHDGRLWAAKTVRWNGSDLSFADDVGRAGKAGSDVRVVDGMMYGRDERGRWVELGSTASIDPASGTTPAEYLAAVREDVGGATLRRITGGMTGLATRSAAGGSTIYSGEAPAGQIARETGFKEGAAIRVLPFGYVAHDEAASADAPLDAFVTVGGGGVVVNDHVSGCSGTPSRALMYDVSLTL